MTPQDLHSLKNKIETAKAEKARAEGALEQIKKTWKDEFGCSTIEEIEAKIKETQDQISSLETKYNSLISELETTLQGAK